MYDMMRTAVIVLAGGPYASSQASFLRYDSLNGEETLKLRSHLPLLQRTA